MLSLFLLAATRLAGVATDVIGVVVVKTGGAVIFAFAGAFLHAFYAQVAKAFDADSAQPSRELMISGKESRKSAIQYNRSCF